MNYVIFTVFFTLPSILFGQFTSSHYVSIDDSTQLAVDVHLPQNYKGDPLPTLAIFTRYWRSQYDRKRKQFVPSLDATDHHFSEHGYIIVKVDVRGTGASYGTRNGEYTPQEVRDAAKILDWIVEQEWSDGNIGSYGVSYEGTTAELLCATKHPALKAVIPGWSDFDVYRSPVRPYGLLASGFIRKWGMYVSWLDNNRSLPLRASVQPVDKEAMKAVLKEHKDNAKVFQLTKKGLYRDSKSGEYTYQECAPLHWKDSIEASDVPMLVLTSWMDAGTAEGTLLRFTHFSNPQKIVLMSTSHGGWCNASPFEVGNELLYPKPNYDEQHQLQLDFMDHYLKGIDKGIGDWPTIRYYNMGEEVFKTSETWPVAGAVDSSFYFQQDGALSPELSANGTDEYRIDFSTTTGKNNRWKTQMGEPVLNLNQRNDEDEKMLTYTTPPLEEDLQITGTPELQIYLSSTHEDGAVLVYLEDVDEHGNSRYITEGGIRLLHRKVAADTTYYLHSFTQQDAALMEPGKMETLTFRLWPTSVLIKKGHRLRIAIAGADKDTFDRLPKRGTPTLSIYRGIAHPSSIILPVIPHTD